MNNQDIQKTQVRIANESEKNFPLVSLEGTQERGEEISSQRKARIFLKSYFKAASKK